VAIKTGAAALTIFVKKICHLLTTWRIHINAVIAAAVTSGAITAAQATTLNLWLDGAQVACDILRVVTGY